MKRTFFLLSLGIGAMLLATQSAYAQGRNCADHATVVARLAEGYGESRQAMGLTNANTILEVFASSETGSWTITITAPGGPTCLVSAGQGFQLLDESGSNDEGA
ncbi:hypothetical protein [Yoonia sp. 208BN28-4]|uniref:hypothetical protein n=1 Tax=Yoonia sp. 208BN28-4 TaxID=3126505 RepID=UPI0030A67CF0